jgi:hypothetical protein
MLTLHQIWVVVSKGFTLDSKQANDVTAAGVTLDDFALVEMPSDVVWHNGELDTKKVVNIFWMMSTKFD